DVSGANLVAGTIRLIKYTTFTGAPSLVVSSLPPGVAGTVANNIASNSIDLTITTVTPYIWTGAINTNWDIAGTSNWLFGATSTNYPDGAFVMFNDTYTLTNVNFATNVSPGGVIISNLTQTYTFNGRTTNNTTNRIIGNATLTKVGG